jgi:predicted acyltransferase
MSTTTTAERSAPQRPASLAQLSPPHRRLVSLDVFRGATIIGMILVNNPGSWSHIYPPLRHAPWHGWTPTDLIFPFFLFIVGVAITLAYAKRLSRGAPRAELVGKAARRALTLFGLGLFMAAYPFVTFSPEFGLSSNVTSIRIMGVLQRIALCYFAATLLALYTRIRTQQIVLVGLLLAYWGLMAWIPVPGHGAGQLDTPGATLAAYLDRLILGTEHLWSQSATWDPEGLLSTLPAVGTTLFGVWAGRLLLAGEDDDHRRAARLLVRGVALVIVGYVWNGFFPINKSIWTSSYAVFTAGQAFCALGLCYWIVEARGRTGWTTPFVAYGVNAITVFVLSGLLAKTLALVKVPGAGGASISLKSYLFQNVFLAVASPVNASLLYALCWIAGWFVFLYALYRRGFVIKV